MNPEVLLPEISGSMEATLVKLEEDRFRVHGEGLSFKTFRETGRGDELRF
ncbi:MAG: hypothetical protein M2R45_00613 [Verrucomicrobia subdivision 3 bacterium]|nr:hypothetical protein [Limisphaerales bacterium]